MPNYESFSLNVNTVAGDSQLAFGLLADGDAEAADGAYADATIFGNVAYLVDESGVGRLQEVRKLAEIVRWRLVVEAVGEPASISWQNLTPPTGMALYLQEFEGDRPVGAALDMTTAGEVTCLEPTEFEIVMGLERRHLVRLQPGWNLVSQPLITTEPAIFDTAYEFTGRTWRRLDRNVVGTAGTSLFVYSDEVSEQVIVGIPAAPGMRLNAGWNLVGAVETSRLPTNVDTAYRVDADGNYHPVGADETLAPGDALLIYQEKAGWFEFEKEEGL